MVRLWWRNTRNKVYVFYCEEYSKVEALFLPIENLTSSRSVTMRLETGRLNNVTNCDRHGSSPRELA